MKRRQVLGLGCLGVASRAFAQQTGGQRANQTPALPRGPIRVTGLAQFRSQVVRLHLRHTWTTVMSSSDFRDVVRVELFRDGVTGLGEGAPIPRYRQTATSALRALETVRPLVQRADWFEYVALLEAVQKRLPGETAAQAALAGALADWLGQKLGLPLHRFWGLSPLLTPITTFSIGIDTPERTRQKVLEAADFPVLKVKVGLDRDEATLAAVRQATQKPLRVDANEGFQTKERALAKLHALAKQGVTLVEQPLPAAALAEAKWLYERSPLPIFADEACLVASDIPRLAGTCHGVNIKLDKCGGVFEALKMIAVARAHGFKVMLGCMISSSVSIAAAAQISPLVDFADLDGFLLIGNDTHESTTVRAGKLVLPDRPGLGLKPLAR